VGKEIDVEKYVKPTAVSKQEIIRRGRSTKYKESHETSLKENEHEQS